MGDCRIRIFVSGLCSSESNDSNNNKPWQLVLNKLFSSDTTIGEVLSADELSLLFADQTDNALWDCTMHPPKDITEWILKDDSNKNKTLYDAGWFPSGTLRVARRIDGVPLASTLQTDDVQYNNTQQATTSAMPVQLAGTLASTTGTTVASSLLPSQVLESVTRRFDDDETMTTSQSTTTALSKQQRALQEKERAKRLDERIQKLNDKNKPVSDQVRKMLIKSRATGSKSLKQQDRIYFDICTISIGQEDQCFRYYSIQDTIGKGIISTFTCSSSNKEDDVQAELLIRRKEEEGAIYRRLPNLMRVYEAIERGFLEKEQVNKVVVRWYDTSSEEPTSSIEDEEQTTATTNPMDATTTSDVEMTEVSDPPPTTTPETISSASSSNNPQMIQDADLAALLTQLDQEEEEKKKSKKKSTSKTSAKVKQMLIKSKAKGDAKRVKMPDRFFFDLVTVSTTTVAKATSQFCFLGQKDPLGRILRDCVKPALGNDANVELLVPTDDMATSSSFVPLSNWSTMTFQEAQNANLLQPFGRIVLRTKQS
ncbi:expressed unknown protein [Seminavis robusta]|uniref:Uncharacterized protein n=1 Tax=Seminavis robusta TaxID=568900 RepID=A0A9N8DMB1_9STRA|nr:expressed unknown protein [Seminavis robusta]|eukprot:Sro163_g073030.1 n/a (539) ;mRNA; r:6926-8542